MKQCVVMDVVEDVLARYSDIVLPIIPEALFLASVDDDIHLDCVYFLLRRLPAVIGDLQLPPRSVHDANNNFDNTSSRSPKTDIGVDSASDENGCNGDNIDHENDDNSETNCTDDTSHTRKRKRK